MQKLTTENTRRRVIAGTLACIITIGLMMVGRVIVNNEFGPSQVDTLLSLDGVISSMMKSPYESAHLSISRIGRDQNYMEVKRSGEDLIVSYRLPSSQQLRHLQALDRSIELLSLEVNKEFNNKDLRVVILTGTPEKMARALRELIKHTFSLNDSDYCDLLYMNLPSQNRQVAGERPRHVPGAELQQAYSDGMRMYLGERYGVVITCPAGMSLAGTISWNEDIWYTQIDELPFEFLDKLRKQSYSGADERFLQQEPRTHE